MSQDIKIAREIIRRLRTQGNQRSYLSFLVDCPSANGWSLSILDKPLVTLAELRYLWPALAAIMDLKKRLENPYSEARLRSVLHKAGMPFIRQADGSSFYKIHGKLQKLYIVHRSHVWEKLPVSQQEAERIYHENL